ncbi:MAG: hypothetical protein DRQ02_08190 [Candidatus Latescibacterota bacterium]|nr:MAG: hypothetical protein DRQ02_08190 [Candidatus Latescibacterota bacterium]
MQLLPSGCVELLSEEYLGTLRFQTNNGVVEMFRWILFISVLVNGLLIGLVTGQALSAVSTWMVGNERRPWQQWGTAAGVDMSIYPGAIQPKEFRQGENLVQAVIPTGGKWYTGIKPVDPDFKEGDLRAWTSCPLSYTDWIGNVLDGDPTTADTYPLHPRYSPLRSMWNLDFGVPVPANRFVFYPRQEGTDSFGNPCKDNYMRGYVLSAASEWVDFLKDETKWNPVRRDFPIILDHNHENQKSIVVVDFPTQYLRLFRLRPTVMRHFEVAEIEVYGRGFVSRAVYTSKIIDLGEKLNFGKIEWAMSKWRRVTKISNEDTLLTLEAAPEAEAYVKVETRSGNDDTPLVYQLYTDTGGLRVVDRETWLRSKRRSPTSPIQPNLRAPVIDDKDNWSPWSVPYLISGQQITSPGPRRYFQFRITLNTESLEEMARVDSLWFQISPLLAEKIVGEVAALGEPSLPGGVSTVVPGKLTTFTYDIRAQFTSASQAGFDSLQIDVPAPAIFDSLQVYAIEGFETIPDDSVSAAVNDGHLTLYFPSRRVGYAGYDRLRIFFKTMVFIHGTRFTGRVWQSGSDLLPQCITPGNANDDVTSDDLKVSVFEKSMPKILDWVDVSPRVFTPNGDRVNDRLQISYVLLKLTAPATINILVYDLSGRLVREIYSGKDRAGRYQRTWDGKDKDGQPVLPGTYIYLISVNTNSGSSQKMGTVSVAY